jgi:hypothetical protein
VRILRLLLGGIIVAASTVIVVFVCADRLAHLAPPRTPVRTVSAEPSATGSIPVPMPAPVLAPKKAAPAIPNGYDTERLRALMQGDPIMRGR